MKKIILLVLCALLFSGCSAEKKQERTVFSMDTHIQMTVYDKHKTNALDKAEQEINRINDKFGIANLNKTLLESDDETKELLKKAQSIKESTGGAFDINVAPVMRIWGFYSSEFSEKKHRVPTQSEIDEALLTAQEGIYIDLGGIAKGYCADRVAEILKADGVQSAVLSFGGNVLLIGKTPYGEDWAVGIQSPFDDGIFATVFASDTSVVTSGDYIRYFEKNGKKYHHILNPETGYPAESDLTSVTVIAEDGAYADGLSTALYVMGREKAEEYWRNHKDFEMVLITKDGKIYCTDVNIQTNHDVVEIRL